MNVIIRPGQLEDRPRVEGAYLVIERYVRSTDPREDQLVKSAISYRVPLAAWPALREAIDDAVREAAQ